jgi:hypothetical protein
MVFGALSPDQRHRVEDAGVELEAVQVAESGRLAGSDDPALVGEDPVPVTHRGGRNADCLFAGGDGGRAVVDGVTKVTNLPVGLEDPVPEAGRRLLEVDPRLGAAVILGDRQ